MLKTLHRTMYNRNISVIAHLSQEVIQEVMPITSLLQMMSLSSETDFRDLPLLISNMLNKNLAWSEQATNVCITCDGKFAIKADLYWT